MLSDSDANVDDIFKTYQVGLSDFMDLKRFMAELDIKPKNLFDLKIDDKAAESEVKRLKKRNESTAFNIYQLKVEENDNKKSIKKYKDPLKDVQTRA